MDARLEDKSKEDLIAEVQELRQIISENETRWKQDRHAGVCLENMYQFVGLLDSEGRLLDANKPALQAGGLTLKEIQGVYFWDTHWFSTSQANMNQLKASFDEVMREKKFIRYEVDVYARQKGAEITTIDFSLLPVLDLQDKNKVVHVVAEGRDIMEKKKAEAEIVRKNQELQELYDKIKDLDESKSMFVANISHELRTPLALILGMTEKVLYSEDAKQWDHDNTKSLETVIDNANILLKHVNDLLDISKLEASEMRVHYMNTNVSEFINRLASYFEILAASQQLTFEVQATPSFTAQLDQEKVEKIVLNLLSNAFKFTPQGGMISLTVRKTKNPSAVASRGAFEIVVADSGPGIPADKRELIFERFRQIEGSASRTHGGTGLGLAIVNEFVHLLGGTIDVGESQWGGAQMTVTLPINAPEGAVIEDPLVREPVKHSPKSIQAAVTGRVKQTLAELTQHLQTVASLSEDTDSDGGLDKFDNSPSTYLNIKRQEPVDSVRGFKSQGT
jgi:PAS domain S-box-containing protein